MKKLGILTLPMILAMAVSGCSKESGGSASKSGSEFKGVEDFTIENIRNVEFKEEKVFDATENVALMKAAGNFGDDYHDFTLFTGNLYAYYTGIYETATRYGSSYRYRMGKNYFWKETTTVNRAGGLSYDRIDSSNLCAYKNRVMYFYNGAAPYGYQYYTYTDVTQDDFDQDAAYDYSEAKAEAFYNYTTRLLSEVFGHAYYGEGLLRYGVLADGSYALVYSDPNKVYYSNLYEYNGKSYVAHVYDVTDSVFIYKKDSNGNARLVSGYCERGYYQDFVEVEGYKVPMEDGKLYFYSGSYYGFTGNSTKDLGVDHYLKMFPKVQQFVTIVLSTYNLNESNQLVVDTTNSYNPYDTGDGTYRFNLPIPIGKPFCLFYSVDQAKFKSGAYIPDEPLNGEITKLAVGLGLVIQRLESADGEEYFYVSPHSGTVYFDYEFKVDAKKAEAVSLFNPIPVPYYY